MYIRIGVICIYNKLSRFHLFYVVLDHDICYLTAIGVCINSCPFYMHLASYRDITQNLANVCSFASDGLC